MAILKSTQVQGKLEVIGADLFVTSSGSKIHGYLDGTASKLDPNGDVVIGSSEATHSLTVHGNTSISGDLTVAGNVVYTGTENLRVKDKNVELNVDESGAAASTVAEADGAGITIKTTDNVVGTETDVKLYFDATSKSWKSNVPFGVDVKGTAESAKLADVAKKTQAALTNGTGIAAFTFDGSTAATVKVDDTYIQNVAKAVKVTSAETADKVAHKLTVAKNDYLTATGDFDGSTDVTLSLNLSDVAKNTDVTAVADRVSTLEKATGSYAKAADLKSAQETLQANIDKKVDSVEGSSLMTQAEHDKLAGIAEGATKVTVDSAMSTTSTNPLQNKVIADEITAIWDTVKPFSISASVSASSYEFDGADHTIKVTVTSTNGIPTSVTVNGTAATKQSSTSDSSVWTATFTKNTQGSTSYPVTASYKGKNYTANPSANAYLPTYAGIVAVDSVTNLNVTSLAKQGYSIKGTKNLTNSQTAGSTYYSWFCANGVTITKITAGGFDVPLEVVAKKSVTVGGKAFEYNCYRTTNNVKASAGSTISYVVA